MSPFHSISNSFFFFISSLMCWLSLGCWHCILECLGSSRLVSDFSILVHTLWGTNDSRSIWVPSPTWETWIDTWLPALDWSIPGYWRHMGIEPAVGWLFSVSLWLSSKIDIYLDFSLLFNFHIFENFPHFLLYFIMLWSEKIFGRILIFNLLKLNL